MNHNWQRDWIDLTPDSSQMVYSCAQCEYIITVNNFLQGKYAMLCTRRPRAKTC